MSRKQEDKTGKRWIKYMSLSDIKQSPRNPKEHDLGALHQSVDRFGYVEPIIWDERRGCLVAGHGRLQAIAQKQAGGEGPPDGVEVGGDGAWCIPVQRGWSSENDAEHEAYMVASNRIVELGGWNQGDLTDLLKDLAENSALDETGYDVDDLDRLISMLPENVDQPIIDPNAAAGAEGGRILTCPHCQETFEA